MTLTLPYPPSLNSYYRRVGNRTLISRKGRAYKKAIGDAVLEQASPKFGTARLSVLIKAYPPDRRRRDLDNLGKALLDSLQHAGVFEDDGQIDDLHLVRYAPMTPGWVLVTIIATCPDPPRPAR